MSFQMVVEVSYQEVLIVLFLLSFMQWILCASDIEDGQGGWEKTDLMELCWLVLRVPRCNQQNMVSKSKQSHHKAYIYIYIHTYIYIYAHIYISDLCINLNLIFVCAHMCVYYVYPIFIRMFGCLCLNIFPFCTVVMVTHQQQNTYSDSHFYNIGACFCLPRWLISLVLPWLTDSSQKPYANPCWRPRKKYSRGDRNLEDSC